jgi:REP element-mobilizing transposase RayT
MRDFDDNDFPLAYLITFRCYGTWLHGDRRGSYRRDSHSRSRVSYVPERPCLEQSERALLKSRMFRLHRSQRVIVEQAVREVCKSRRWRIRAISARSNHVHVVVSTLSDPEPILLAFKSYSTRALRSAGLANDIQPWSRHGSTVYLWKESDLEKPVEYVALGQDHQVAR